MITAPQVYAFAVRQIAAARWLAYALDDESDSAEGDSEFAALRALIAKWEADSYYAVGAADKEDSKG